MVKKVSVTEMYVAGGQEAGGMAESDNEET